jgi:hypothetical protein
MLSEAFTMRRHLIPGLPAGLLAAAPLAAQSKARGQNVPEIPRDDVLVYTRNQRTRLSEFDQKGRQNVERRTQNAERRTTLFSIHCLPDV